MAHLAIAACSDGGSLLSSPKNVSLTPASQSSSSPDEMVDSIRCNNPFTSAVLRCQFSVLKANTVSARIPSSWHRMATFLSVFAPASWPSAQDCIPFCFAHLRLPSNIIATCCGSDAVGMSGTVAPFCLSVPLSDISCRRGRGWRILRTIGFKFSLSSTPTRSKVVIVVTALLYCARLKRAGWEN